jgi:putative acetyltransferase
MSEQEEGALPSMSGLELRYTTVEDAKPLKEWLLEPNVLHAFPMVDEAEVDDAVKHWIGFSKYRCSLTAVLNGEVAGIATLCLMPYRKLAHQCLLSIVVGEKFRGQGIGTVLMNNVLFLAKDHFKIEVVYLEVYEHNPAISLYKRFGFREIGFQKHFMKEGDSYVGKVIMERIL